MVDWVKRAAAKRLEVYNFIDGERRAGGGSEEIVSYSPRDGSRLYTFAESTSSDIDAAVYAAKTALYEGPWREFRLAQRKSVLNRLIELIEDHKETFALYECLDVGKPISKTLTDDVDRAISKIRPCIEGADRVLSDCSCDGGAFAFQNRRPVGVVGAIIGWNYPLGLATGRIAPALAMGNTVVLKPSEFSSLSACFLAELAIGAGIPPGVVNVVNGSGATVGDSLARHEDVSLLAFVGSSATGKRLLEASGQSNMKRLLLECGGKSPILVFEDYPDDLDTIADRVVALAYSNQGAVCVAGSRLLVAESIKYALLEKVVQRSRAIFPGDPLDPDTTYGGIVNEAHLNKILEFIAQAEKAGARRHCGGERLHKDTGGFYLTPAVFDDVSQDMPIVQEEIFGPVLTVQSFKDEAEAIALANGTRYGLAAYAFTTDAGRVQRLSQHLTTGILQIYTTMRSKGGSVSISAEPQKQSGFGPGSGIVELAAHTVHTSSIIHC